ncbi:MULTISPECIES: hypothetical protein [Burkholderia]|uniref:hypothetical protein n=1 Tax=Burkholderia TaxID=32008 RepID=UPI0007537751|nr:MULTISPECIES: hypothetical protein [Burkholderia]AOJ72230.1 hypothetical protein WS78_26245 [Burkholderia savannae]KVG44281.1 hypothetical protein WS77_10135 [Burkholderia sp. MSMB0265]KVG87808.1 hypothetical protein WS81_26115 [Burkholderia sp. MSMB2040]KVG96346.1 hypothetical protein WS83_03025 [Burkholderia sp. MSMB2042]KVG97210.1 hypothetical protein WS82_30345 [Burkholderia sp. MSMB2041]
MSNDKNIEFLTKLQALLAEYGATIAWSCSPYSDTHGIYDEAMTIEVGNKEIARTESGWLDAVQLKQIIGD